MPSVADTLIIIRAMGISVSRTKDLRYRVNYFQRNEKTAYYTTDANDAIATARRMAAERPELLRKIDRY